MPPYDAEVWNLSLENVEGMTGRVLAKEHTRVADLGSTKCSFDTGNVLYSKLRPYLNKVVVPDAPGVGTSELIPLRPDPKRLTRGFLAWYLRSPDFLDFAKQHTRGANLPRLSTKALWKHEIRLPSIAEQHRIVARIEALMERVDEAAQLRAVTAKEVEYLEGAVFADFVEGHLGGENVPVLPMGKLLLDTQYGTSSKANTREEGTPILRMPNIKDGHLDVSDLKHIDLSEADLTKYTLQRGDILINRTNSLEHVGKAAVFNLDDGHWVFASYLVRLVADESKVLPEYLAATINSRIGRRYVHQTARRAIGMVNINVKEITAMPIPVPSLDAQRAVVAMMADVRRAVQQMRAHLPAFNEAALRASILRKAFAGEL